MPWKAFKVDSEFCVFKLDGEGDRTGKSLGCHSTRKKANRQVAALNVQENKNMDDVKGVTEDKEMHIDYHGEVYDTDEFVPFGTTSFEEYDDGVEAQKAGTQVKKDAKVFSEIISNVLRSDEITDVKTSIVSVAKEFASRVGENLNLKQKKFKTEGGVKFPASDFAHVPDKSKPSTWKLRLAQGKPGNITKAQLGRAAAAFSAGGFRGNKVQIPSNKVGAVKARIRREYKKLGVKTEDIPDSVKELSQFMVYKDTVTDQYRFFTSYSNNIRDSDNPPEIIASESHIRFEEMVDKGEVPLPQLWLWHIPSLHIGETEVITYDKETGVAMAAGYFFKEAEPIAEVMAENQDLWMVSHGMPGTTVVRSGEDDTVIVQHITKEISPLPDPYHANKWVGFSILSKELSMAIPKDKQKKLKELGITDEMLEDLEASNKSLVEQVEELGLERKESDPPAEETPAEEPVAEPVEEEVVPEVEPVTEEPATEEPSAEPVAEPTEEDVPAEDAPEAPFTDEQITELKNTFGAFGEMLLKEVAVMLQPITDAVIEQKKTSEDTLKKTLDDSPLVSLQDLVLGGPLLQSQSATKSDQTIVDGRTKGAKDGPEITEDKVKHINSGNPILDMVLGDIIQDSLEPAKPAA